MGVTPVNMHMATNQVRGVNLSAVEALSSLSSYSLAGQTFLSSSSYLVTLPDSYPKGVWYKTSSYSSLVAQTFACVVCLAREITQQKQKGHFNSCGYWSCRLI